VHVGPEVDHDKALLNSTIPTMAQQEHLVAECRSNKRRTWAEEVATAQLQQVTMQRPGTLALRRQVVVEAAGVGIGAARRSRALCLLGSPHLSRELLEKASAAFHDGGLERRLVIGKVGERRTGRPLLSLEQHGCPWAEQQQGRHGAPPRWARQLDQPSAARTVGNLVVVLEEAHKLL